MRKTWLIAITQGLMMQSLPLYCWVNHSANFISHLQPVQLYTYIYYNIFSDWMGNIVDPDKLLL